MSTSEIPLHPRPYRGMPRSLLDLNPAALGQGGMPHLVELLLAEYRQSIDERNVRLHDRGLEPEDADQVIAAATPLLDFFREYLTENRPVQAFPVDENFGLQLSNNLRFVVSPGTPTIQGTMQDAGSIGISTGLSQPGQGGAQPYQGYEIR